MLRRSILSLLGLTVFSCAIVSLSNADEEAPAKEKSELSKEAEAAYLSSVAEYEIARISIEELYQWSLRMMKSELKDGAGEAAIHDHLERMRKLHQKAEALFRTGSRGGSEKAFHASKYFVLEAEGMKASE